MPIRLHEISMTRHDARSARLAGAALLILAALGCACERGEPELLIFGAASLSDVLTEIGQTREAAGGPRLRFNFAGSNLLARQIDAGAPASLFVSADHAQVDWLESRGHVAVGSARVVAGNALVVVTPLNRGAALRGPRDLLSLERIVMADPEGVPAGVHARAWLEEEGLWASLSERVIPALDVRAALAAVVGGNVDAGVVYATDARSTDAVTVAFEVPAARAHMIAYLAAPVGPASAGALAFLDYLEGPEAQEIFKRHGFHRVQVAGVS